MNEKLQQILDEWGDPKGWDSLDQLQVISEIEEKLNVDLGDVWFETTEQIHETVKEALDAN